MVNNEVKNVEAVETAKTADYSAKGVLCRAQVGTKKNGEKFIYFEYSDGKYWCSLHFKRDVNLAAFNGMEKFKADFEYFNEPANAVYKLAWASGVSNIVKIK